MLTLSEGTVLLPILLLGHQYELNNQEEVGDLEFPWFREYGTAFKVYQCFGDESLFIADPKALQYIFHTSGYQYIKPMEGTYTMDLMVGSGLVSADTEVHKRQRKVMNPAFATTHLRSFMPMFQNSASRLSAKWREELSASGDEDLNICVGLGKATLDALGDAAFDYRFGALDDSTDNVLTNELSNLFTDSLMNPSKWDAIFKGLWRYIPTKVIWFFISRLPTREYKRFKKFRATTQKEASGLVKRVVLDETKGTNDIMSILVRSNLAEDERRRLNHEEVLAQMGTLILAGQETTASTMTWLLYELARHPEDQRRLREEIIAMREKVGNARLTYADYDEMEFLSACIKEALRLHPIVPTLMRTATRDDFIPLSFPIQTRSGTTIDQVPIGKGQDVFLSLAGYNRLPAVWGPDADSWNPKRFLDDRQQTTVGVYANLMSFSAGIRGCIGWRFALFELQCVVVELVGHFEFSPPKIKSDMRRAFAGLMMPLIKDRLHEGVSMPLQVRSLSEA